MAVLTVDEKTALRKEFYKENITAEWEKEIINQTMQAIEDWWVDNQASLVSDINIATSPVVLSNPTKKAMGRRWLFNKFLRGG